MKTTYFARSIFKKTRLGAAVFLAAMSGIFSPTVQAWPRDPVGLWQEAFSCENSALVVDVGSCTEQGCVYQLVLRHRDAIQYLLSRWAFSERHLNARGEFIMSVRPIGENGYLFFEGEENWSVNGRNLFRLGTVKGSEAAVLEVRFLRGFGPRTMDVGRIADWTFHGCQIKTLPSFAN
jgi:hypothetical protein